MTDSARARRISDLIEESVYGPRGEETPPCANAWEVSKLIASLEARLEALEATQPKPEEVTDEVLMAAARAAVDTYRYASELPYFMSKGSSEYEPMLLALRAASRLGALHMTMFPRS